MNLSLRAALYYMTCDNKPLQDWLKSGLHCLGGPCDGPLQGAKVNHGHEGQVGRSGPHSVPRVLSSSFASAAPQLRPATLDPVNSATVFINAVLQSQWQSLATLYALPTTSSVQAAKLLLEPLGQHPFKFCTVRDVNNAARLCSCVGIYHKHNRIFRSASATAQQTPPSSAAQAAAGTAAEAANLCANTRLTTRALSLRACV